MDLELGVATKFYEETRTEGLKLGNKLIHPDRGCLGWHDKSKLMISTLQEAPWELSGLGFSSTHPSDSEPLYSQEHESNETNKKIHGSRKQRHISVTSEIVEGLWSRALWSYCPLTAGLISKTDHYVLLLCVLQAPQLGCWVALPARMGQVLPWHAL